MNFFNIYRVLCFKTMIYFVRRVDLPCCPSWLSPHPNLLSSILHVIQLLGPHGKVDLCTLFIHLCDLVLTVSLIISVICCFSSGWKSFDCG